MNTRLHPTLDQEGNNQWILSCRAEMCQVVVVVVGGLCEWSYLGAGGVKGHITIRNLITITELTQTQPAHMIAMCQQF